MAINTAEEAAANNWDIFMKNGPGLNYGYRSYVIEIDRAGKRILLGGLGGMGVGQMWFADDGRFADHPGYAEALARAGGVT